MKKPLGIKQFRKFLLVNYFKGTHAIIVKKSGFTKSAHQLAKSNKVELINEYQLKDLEKFIV